MEVSQDCRPDQADVRSSRFDADTKRLSLTLNKHGERMPTAVLVDCMSQKRSELTGLDNIIEGIDIKPMAHSIKNADLFSRRKQLLKEEGYVGFPILWVG